MSQLLNLISYSISFLGFLILAQAQRPSYAGVRPPDGLNQKDKYFINILQNVNSLADGVQNRFGGVEKITTITPSKQIPYGHPQNPPIGWPVVIAEPVSTALLPPSAMPPLRNATPNISFGGRFGGNADDASSSPSDTTIRALSSETRAAALPLDALGDQLLVDQLNRLPVDKRPFWFLNYEAIEAQRNSSVSNVAGSSRSRSFFAG